MARVFMALGDITSAMSKEKTSGNNPSTERSATLTGRLGDFEDITRSVSLPMSLLQKEFQVNHEDGCGKLTTQALAIRWAAAAEEHRGAKLTPEELDLVAMAVDRAFEEMDVNHDGAIDLAEFVHQGLLDACLADPAMIEVITEQLEGNPSALSRIVTKWQELDLECRGVLPLDVVAKRLMGDLTWMASRSSRITRLAPLRDDE